MYEKELLSGRLQHISRYISGVTCMVKCRKLLIYGVEMRYESLKNVSLLYSLIDAINFTHQIQSSDLGGESCYSYGIYDDFPFADKKTGNTHYTISSFVKIIINKLSRL
mgnify:FL=1